MREQELATQADIDGEIAGIATAYKRDGVEETQPGTLRRQLARVLRDGYATTVEEMSLGACSVAVPILAESRVVAALGIVVPDLRNDRARFVAALQVAAQGIGRALAARADPA